MVHNEKEPCFIYGITIYSTSLLDASFISDDKSAGWNTGGYIKYAGGKQREFLYLFIMRATILTDIPNPDKSFEYSAQVKDYDAPKAQPHEAVVKIQAAAMNHRYEEKKDATYIPPHVTHDMLLLL